jgi:hypothetical protein
MMCVWGELFDVSDRPDKYGVGGVYQELTGHDITHGLDIGDDSHAQTNKFFDLFKHKSEEEGGAGQTKSLMAMTAWLYHFEKEYGKPVGTLKEYADEGYHLPEPPVVEQEGECSIM